ncbi:hypothetical protein, partial [Eoetvoesiella caeni]
MSGRLTWDSIGPAPYESGWSVFIKVLWANYMRMSELETLIHVSADVILTHCAGVKLTHLGEYGGFLAAGYVDPGASSGNQGIN